MKKISPKFYTPFFLILSLLVCISALVLILSQTKIFQDYALNILTTEAKKEGIEIKLKGLQSNGPFKWYLDEGFILWEDGKKLEMKKLQVRIAALPLFMKKLTFTSLKIHDATFSFSPSQEKTNFEEISLGALPLSLSVKALKIKNFLLNNVVTNKTLHLNLKGRVSIKKGLGELQVDLLFQELALNNILKIQLLSSQKKEVINGNIQTDIKNSENLTNFFDIPLKTSLKAFIRCRGKWSFWEKLKQRSAKDSLSFTFKADLDDLEIESIPLLDKTWSIQSDYTLWSDLSSSFENLSVISNELKLLGKASFSSSFTPLTASIVASLKDLSNLTSPSFLRLGGQLDAKIGLSPHAFLCLVTSPSLEIGNEIFTPSTVKIEALHKEKAWTGSISSSFQQEKLPWNASSEFTIKENLVTIKDIVIETEQTKISGEGHWNINQKIGESSLFLLANNLKLFRSLFPGSDLEGKLGGSLSLHAKEANVFLETNLLLKNVRYQTSIVDSLRIEAALNNVLQTPVGNISLECTNLLVKGGQFDSLTFASNEQENGWKSFSITANGSWKESFQLSSTGLWKNEEEAVLIQSESFLGSLFKSPFQSSPFSFYYSDEKISIDSCQIQIGNGSFSLKGSLTKEEAFFETEGTHLPLHMLSLFYPSIAVHGNTSFQGSFLGSKENIKGELIATIEEVDFLEKIKGKGSLQIHFTPLTAQIHSHFYATQNQFLDCTATIPLNYFYLPFKAEIDPIKPLMGELRMQGAIEDLLAFLQTTSQKASGWVTGHLFLSGNSKNPFIQGKIDLENGSYENYISGTRLKNIEAALVAKGASIELTHFHTLDSKNGEAGATGTLLLDKKELFPFKAKLELNNLTLMQSETLEAAATGDLDFTGDLLSAKAEGGLIVDHTAFTISDNLQTEIPSLPITYINKPIHLQRFAVNLPATYPVNLELLCTAKDTVFIKGKGLDSQWQGDVLLTGTPLSPIGKGSLTLKKGDFTFSGKTFTLMQGDLSFSDKPNQDAYLKLTGQLQLSQATITANMQGPLTSPRLTFQSTPALPTSSILSLILFNKDISEISPLQTLGLAQVIMSLSGNGGPGVLEAIRKSIGIDRLSITGKDGSDEISLQIGWYLTHGVTVSLSQSATSSDVTVEVDLKNGFVFEAETQNQEEGKFSLKWNKNY